MGAARERQSRPDVVRIDNVVFYDHDRVTAWVQGRIEGADFASDTPSIGIEDSDGNLIAGVAYHDYNGMHCSVSIAAEPSANWSSRAALFKLFYYPFETLNCQAISATIASSNLPSINLAAKLGFYPEAYIRFAAHDGSALVVMKMLREQCKWIGRYGQGQRQRTGFS